MRKTAIVLALSAVLSTYSQSCYGADFEELLSGKQVPLTVQLQNLDNSWRQIAISGQFEMGDLIKDWSTLFSGRSYTNLYYTQGKTVTIDNETYVIAYRLRPKGEGLTYQTIVENTMAMGCTESSMPVQLTPETSLTLSLLNLRTIGSLSEVRPFNLTEELAASEKTYQEAKVTCEELQLQTTNSQVESHLSMLGEVLIGYTSENKGILPKMDNPDVVKSALQDLVWDSSAFVHPETSEPYQPNPTLSGKKLAAITNPEKVVAFYEATAASDGTIGVVFLDCTVKRIAAEEWLSVKQASGLR